jgi:DNA-binding MarR family transcriptional regulator
MHKLKPTLWRTCRVLANIQRLQLLYALFDLGDRSVAELAKNITIRPEHASIHLRALNSRGLIKQYRRKMMVLSCAEANEELEASVLILRALKECHQKNITVEELFRQSTAFTHARRIEIIQTIPLQGTTKDRIHEVTHISYTALTRHLNKLIARGFVKGERNHYARSLPPDPLSRALLQIIDRQR